MVAGGLFYWRLSVCLLWQAMNHTCLLMSTVWEKTVSAAIRLDIFVVDFPIMFISRLPGALGLATGKPLKAKEE
jgi:hypothetical protein